MPPWLAPNSFISNGEELVEYPGLTVTAFIAGMGPDQGDLVLAQRSDVGARHDVHPVAAVVPRATSNIRADRGEAHLASVLFISVDRLTPKVPCLCDPALRRVCLFD